MRGRLLSKLLRKIRTGDRAGLGFGDWFRARKS